jgi:hypothetical protein
MHAKAMRSSAYAARTPNTIDPIDAAINIKKSTMITIPDA